MRNLHVYYIYAPDRKIKTMMFLPNFFLLLFYFKIMIMIFYYMAYLSIGQSLKIYVPLLKQS